jgi:16S rRNA (guanine966-N2)-methyltransferase
MRIIAGKYKGQSLNHFTASHIRPTTDRVKETLFNILQIDIPGARVLDLFAGTGNLGLEALSRGAAEVLFVESHPKSIEIIRKNIQKLKVTEPHVVWNQDVLRFLNKPTSSGFDIIFADPPFTEAMADEVLTVASQSEVFGLNTIMAIESAKKEKLEKQYGDVILTDQRVFGDKILSFFRKSPSPS